MANTMKGRRCSSPVRPAWIVAIPLGAFAVSALAVAAVIACSSSTTVVSTPDAADAASATTFGTSDCGTCVATSCGAERTACGAEPSCAAYLTCVEACPVDATGNVDSSCASACPAATGAGMALAGSYTMCRQEGAGAACASCGGQADAGSPILNQQCAASTQTDACQKCGDEHCCNTDAACSNEPECITLTKCLIACESDTADGGQSMCNEACYDAHPKGLAVLAPRLACTHVYCGQASACNVGGDPACDMCEFANCTNEYVACYGDPSCYRVVQCFRLCGNVASCVAACQSAHPEANAVFGVFDQCLLDRCKGECSQP